MAKLKPEARGMTVAHTRGRAPSTWTFLCCCCRHRNTDGCTAEQPWRESQPKWDAGFAGGSLTCGTTAQARLGM